MKKQSYKANHTIVKKVVLSLACSLIFGSAFAADVYQFQNNTPLTLTFTGNSSIPCSDSNGSPQACSIVLAPGQSQYFNQANFYISYFVNTITTYYGFYLGSPFNAPAPLQLPYAYDISKGKTQPEQAITTASGKTVTLSLSPTLPTAPVTPYTAMPFRGVNLSGMEAGGAGDYTQAYWNSSAPNLADAQYFVAKGMNTVRIPINWGFLTPTADTSSEANLSANQKFYLNTVRATVQQFLQAGVNVVLDLHSYMRYQKDGSAGAGSVVSPANVAAVWTLLANNLKPLAQQYDGVSHSNQLILEIMNEPYGMNTTQVLDNSNAGISAIRNAGLNNLILVEGNAWSGLHSWMENDNHSVMTSANIKDTKNNYALAVHQYFDADGSGTNDTCQSLSSFQNYLNFSNFVTWMHENHMRVFVSEFGAPTDSACAPDVDWMLTQMDNNTYNSAQAQNGGFIGWTAWVGGHSWTMGNVNDMSPNKTTGVENVNMLNAYSKHLKGAVASTGNLKISFGSNFPAGIPSTTGVSVSVDGQVHNDNCNLLQGCTLTNIASGSHQLTAKDVEANTGSITYIYKFSPVTASVQKDSTTPANFSSTSQVLYTYDVPITYSLNGLASTVDNTGISISLSGTGLATQTCKIPAGQTTANCSISYKAANDQIENVTASTPTLSGYNLINNTTQLSLKNGVATPANLSASFEKQVIPTYQAKFTVKGDAAITGNMADLSVSNDSGSKTKESVSVNGQALAVSLPAGKYTVAAANINKEGKTYVANINPASFNLNGSTTPSIDVTYAASNVPAAQCVATIQTSAPNAYWNMSANGKTAYMTTMQISVKNNGSAVIPHPWTVSIVNPSYLVVQNAWNWTAKTVTQGAITGGSIADWQNIQPGQSASFGLNMGAAEANTASFMPTQVLLNGQSCTIQ